jgi:beta-carotene hydroxylase
METSVPADFRDATKIARAHERLIAWPTIVLCALVVGGFWSVAWLAATGQLSLWLAVLINAFFAYAAYTPAHEAVHGNVHRKAGASQTDNTWLNNLIGALASSALLHNFPMHQLSHLAHHAHTNNPERDPDHWMAVRGVMPVTLRAFGLIGAHYIAEFKLCFARSSDGKQRLIVGIAQNLLWFAAVAWLALRYQAWPALAATVLSAWLGSAFLAFAFDWLPHYPHQSRERFLDTRCTQFHPYLNGLASAFFLYQNYHHVHHLWPRVPFHQYRAVHIKLESYLIGQGVEIQQIGTTAKR